MVKQFKYLEVTFSSDATWSAHINTVCLKARRPTGMLYCKLYCHADTSSLMKLYPDHSVATRSQSRVPMSAVYSAHINTRGTPSLAGYVSRSNITVTDGREVNQYSQ